MKMSKIICTLALFLPGSFPVYAQQAPKSNSEATKDSMKVMPGLKFRPTPVTGKDYYYRSLGMACKLEFKIGKATKVPLRLRLGSLQQTDYMERKPNVQKPE